MNAASILGSIALTTTALSLGLAAPASAGENACDPRVLESPTKFPEGAASRGQKGTVLVEVLLDGQGRATQARVLESSGHRLLDRAATRSIRSDWRFDVSACKRQELPANQVVAIEFRNGETDATTQGTRALARRF